MEIRVNKIKFYKHRNWFISGMRYKHIKGVWFRVLGIHVNIMEKDATDKLIAKFKSK
ncbi:MAG: hypothetical protein ABIP51_04085 [Bacteroidia bacterium]